ncbi:hypothetical protein [Enterococcus sp. S86.2]|uniref:hypothetical protein n=1 Tax=Enterococcus sp. S86.2 TaxID=3031299 RepID=UPI0026EC695B|nr:hypothetical protein [Enterococcus sp. S86.2]
MSTIVFDLSIAIVIGIIFSCIFFITKSEKISIITEEIEWQRINLPASTVGSDWQLSILLDHYSSCLPIN